MTNTNHAATAARSMTSEDLRRVVAALEAELIADFAACNGKGTHAHLGKIELLTAASNELAMRSGGGYSHVPYVEVDRETAYGSTARISFSVRVF